MNQLPEDIIIVIFNKLLVPDLINIISTCKYFYNIGNYEGVWRDRFSKKYLKKHKIRNFKKYYCDRNNKNKFGLIVNSNFTYLRSKNKIGSLPNSICILTNLTELNLFNNNLKFIQKQISCLISLKTLDLSNNAFENFPTNISYLTNLTKLVLGRNSISYIPDNISGLISLNNLNLSYNKLTEFPIFVCRLRNLNHLFLESMTINRIPNDIKELTNLYYLSMVNSHLQLIDEDINLPNLAHLHLFANELGRIPDWLYNSTSIKYIDLSHNPGLVLKDNFNNNLETLIVNNYQLPFYYGMYSNKNCKILIEGETYNIINITTVSVFSVLLLFLLSKF